MYTVRKGEEEKDTYRRQTLTQSVTAGEPRGSSEITLTTGGENAIARYMKQAMMKRTVYELHSLQQVKKLHKVLIHDDKDGADDATIYATQKVEERAMHWRPAFYSEWYCRSAERLPIT